MRHPGPPESQVRVILAEVILEVAGISTDLDRSFFEAGLTSALLVEVHSRLQARLRHAIPVTDLFRYPTRRTLARRVAAGSGAEPAATSPPQAGTGRLAPRHRRELRARLWAPASAGKEP